MFLTFDRPHGVVVVHGHQTQGVRLVCIGAKGFSESKVLVERTGHLISLCLSTQVEWMGDTVLNNMNLTTNLHHRLSLAELSARLNNMADMTTNYEPEIMSGAMDIVVGCLPVHVMFRIYYSGKVVVLKCMSQAALDGAWEHLSPHLAQTQSDQQPLATAIDTASEEELDTQRIIDSFDELLAEFEM